MMSGESDSALQLRGGCAFLQLRVNLITFLRRRAAYVKSPCMRDEGHPPTSEEPAAGSLE